MTKILTVIEPASHGILETQDDTILWISAMIKTAGGGLAILLRGNAVNYALNGQDVVGLTIGGITLKPPTIDKDVAELTETGVPVYAVMEDPDARGINRQDLVKGVQVLSRKGIASLWNNHEAVWHW